MSENDPIEVDDLAPEREPEPLGGPSADDLMAEIKRRANERAAEPDSEPDELEPAGDGVDEAEEPEPAEAADEADEQDGNAPEADDPWAEVRRLREARDRAEARMLRAEKIAGREAGRAGFLDQQNQQLRQQLEARGAGPEPTYDEPEPVEYEPEPREYAPRPVDLQQVMAEQVAAFAAAHPGVAARPEFVAAVRRLAAEEPDLALDADKRYLRLRTDNVLAAARSKRTRF